MDKYHTLDKEKKASIVAAADSTGRKDYGYQRSLELTTERQDVCFWKAIFSCTRQRTELSSKVVELAKVLKIKESEYRSLTYKSTQVNLTK